MIQLGEIISSLFSECESPIERRLRKPLDRLAEQWGFRVVPQYKLARFRYDFAVLNKNDELLALIECDGKEFHSTPEQLANDKAKDLAARAAGVWLYRFKGKEIYRDAEKCANQVIFGVWRA